MILNNNVAFNAMLFAREKHALQRRKYTNNPYADHLAEVRVRSSGEAEDNARLMAAISKATGGVA